MRDVRLHLAFLAVLAVAAACQDDTGTATAGTGKPAQPAAGSSAATPPPAPAGSGTTANAGPSPSGSGATAPAPAKPGGKPIRATLIEAAGGKPVLLALDGKGQLIARTGDGAFTRVLLAGPYGDGAPDADRDLVWLRDDAKLDVLDLRGSALTPVTVVTFPDKAMAKLGEHITEPPSWSADGINIMLDTRCSKGAGLRLEWARNGESGSDWAKGFRAVARPWWTAEEKRAKQELGAEPYSTKATRRKVPRDVGSCKADVKEEYGKNRCGHGEAFGATGVELVIVGASAERCPGDQCRLFDPKTKKLAPVPSFAEDDDEAPTCGPFLFDATGKWFAMTDQVCGPDLKCSSVGRLAIGWLEGNRRINK